MQRVALRMITIQDAEFLYELMNMDKWKQFIGDRNIQSIADAENYINERILPSFDENGFGMYVCQHLENKEAIGLCGLVQRTYLDKPDIGFALLSNYEGKGLMLEACELLLRDYKSELFAICDEKNLGSIKLLKKLGFFVENNALIPPEESEPLLLFRKEAVR